MDIPGIEDQSDDEIFIGEFTMKEAIKRLIPADHRQTVGYCGNIDSKNDADTSFKLIEAHSAPDISPDGDLLSLPITMSESGLGLSSDTVSDWDVKPDDSFLRLEQMVRNMCMSPDKLNHQNMSEPNKYSFTNQTLLETEKSTTMNETNNEINSQVDDKETPIILLNKKEDTEAISTQTTDNELAFTTPLKNNFTKDTILCTPQADVFKTPSSELKIKTPIFKTPGNPSSHKKQSATPSRKYQNVASPVAAYIRNCPQVPLMKDVCPKKPLPGISSIPKPLKHTLHLNLGNKENLKQDVNGVKIKKQDVKLPAVAYRTAKETKMIDIPDVGKMPQNNWAKQVASSIPRAMVVRHNHRETNSAKKTLQGQDSFADLPVHQADLSVCIQKSSFSKPNKNV